MSFDVLKHSLPNIELYGTLGSLKAPDPNNFGGSVMISTLKNKDYTEIPLITPYCENSRGIGLADTIKAIEEKRQNNEGN
mgnify:CR=1 FL=1